jgi:hypothetical protein
MLFTNLILMMTDLSPAAQAVLKAYYSTDDDLAAPALAAALRAAADQVNATFCCPSLYKTWIDKT